MLRVLSSTLGILLTAAFIRFSLKVELKFSLFIQSNEVSWYLLPAWHGCRMVGAVFLRAVESPCLFWSMALPSLCAYQVVWQSVTENGLS